MLCKRTNSLDKNIKKYMQNKYEQKKGKDKNDS